MEVRSETETQTGDIQQRAAFRPGGSDSVSPSHSVDKVDHGAEVNPVPTGGQKKKKAIAKNVLSFKLPSGGQKKATSGKRKTSSRLPTGGQDDETEWLKSLLPTAKKGDWWETPADDQGLKIKYRWRVGSQKNTYVFRRLGKRHIQTLKGQPYERQVWLIADRIFGELQSKDRGDVAARLSPRPVLDRVVGADY